MKQLFFILMSAGLFFPVLGLAQRADGGKSAKKISPVSASSNLSGNLKKQLSSALQMAQSGQYGSAANNLFSLGRRPELSEERVQIKYILGTMLMELKLPQTAAFQFVDVIRTKNPKYTKLAVEKLSVVADTLGDDTILNYAVSRVDLNDFPSKLRDMIYFRLGEVKLHSNEFGKSADLFGKVHAESSYYYQSLFNKGLAELEEKKPEIAVQTFGKMLSARRKAPPTDTNKVAAQMGIARALYQNEKWDEAVEAYSQIPRDNIMWHDAIFEQSWAMLRSARFRSALSNFQTLHSAYYEDFYFPETMVLRAIVYLYICKYDEMEKVLTLFEKTYGPVRDQITSALQNSSEKVDLFADLEKAQAQKNSLKRVGLRLPYLVLRNILAQGDVKRSLQYLERLKEEKSVIENNQSLRNSPLGQYALKILANRSRNTKLAINDMAKVRLGNMKNELRDLFEQVSFIRYEVINVRKEAIKKKISNKDIPAGEIDENVNREFYVQNGYEYYPFKGEYWHDEVGNYHYLGKHSCE